MEAGADPTAADEVSPCCIAFSSLGGEEGRVVRCMRCAEKLWVGRLTADVRPTSYWFPASPNAPNTSVQHGNTLVHVAVENGHLPVLLALLSGPSRQPGSEEQGEGYLFRE